MKITIYAEPKFDVELSAEESKILQQLALNKSIDAITAKEKYKFLMAAGILAQPAISVNRHELQKVLDIFSEPNEAVCMMTDANKKETTVYGAENIRLMHAAGMNALTVGIQSFLHLKHTIVCEQPNER